MEEYIEKGKLINALYGNDCITFQGLKIIHELPVFERKHGKWIFTGDSTWNCSVCDEYVLSASNYCPNCGAKMEVTDGTA